VSLAWDLIDGLAFARAVEAEIQHVGWHVALGGSVLHRSCSDKDLDLIVYPHARTGSNRRPRLRELRKALGRCGLHLVRDHKEIRKFWGRQGSRDRKFVEAWGLRGRRVDVFVLS
jgi:hypothetical protein